MLVGIVAAAQRPEESELEVTHFPAPAFPQPERVPPAPEVRTPVQPGRPSAETPTTEFPAPVNAGPTWINSAPLTLEHLSGHVVLMDFWEYTCINCIRTFAQNKKWYERYHKYGFELVGVHDPEFDIAYSVANVEAAVKRFGLRYPIVVDDQFHIWNSYHNSSWPSRFLVDAKGIVRYHRNGEGGDSAFERAIQSLLREAHPALQFPPNYTIPQEADAFAPSCGSMTPEMYVGDWFGRGVLANPEGYRGGKTLAYKLPAEIADGHAAVVGPWQTDKNGMIYRGKAKNALPQGDRLEMRYHARELYAVINVAHGHASPLYIQQDGKGLTTANKGVDVQFDSEGRSYIEAREPRMYYLVSNPSSESHSVALFPTRSGLTINSFTFGNNCQTDFPHL
jgi:thiol-disulfide isomerase/thioredoxin